MIKSISNSEKLNSPSQSSKTSKQLTLFELNNKSITVGNKENKKMHHHHTNKEDDIVILDDNNDFVKNRSKTNLMEISNRYFYIIFFN
jgi:hypothetical protein